MSSEYVEVDRAELALHVPSGPPMRDDDLREGYCSYCLQVWPCEESTRLILLDLIAELKSEFIERPDGTTESCIHPCVYRAEARLREVTGGE